MKKLLLLCLFSFFTAVSASAQFFQWAQKQENAINTFSTPYGSAYSGGNFMAKGGNILATTGLFYHDITLGNQTFIRSDSTDAYLAVHDLSGNVLWAKQIVTKAINQPSVTVDLNQNIIISGIFQDSLFIDGLIFKAGTANKKGVYIVKFSSNGTLVWARSSDFSTGNLQVNPTHVLESSITSDAAGNVYVAGTFSDSLTFGSTTLQSNQYYDDVYLVKYNPAGAIQWAIITGGPSLSDHGISVKATSGGTIYLSCTVSSIPFNPFMGYRITKINTNGNVNWSVPIMNAYSVGCEIAIDQSENVYLTGYYYNNITIGSTTLAANPGSCFLAKLNSSGNIKWARNIASWLTSGSPAAYILDKPQIAISPNNKLAIAGLFSGAAQFSGSTVNIPSSAAGTFITQLDTAGFTVWVNTIMDTNQQTVIKPSELINDGNDNFYLSGYFNNTFQIGNTTISTNGQSAGFLTKMKAAAANSVSGKVFIDANSNGTFDGFDTPCHHLILGSNLGNLNITSAPDGRYTLYVPAGSTTISLANAPKYYSSVPASHAVTFSGTNQIQTGKDFALQPIPNQNDVKVTVTAISVSRPGFSFKYRLTFQNVGTTVLSDSLNFVYNAPAIRFDSASVVPATSVGNRLSWYYQNLQPNETRNIDVSFWVPTNSVMGTPLTATATIKPLASDLFPADNFALLNHRIVASSDPNDKQVDKPFISPTVAANGEFLDYTIRFQNTGTDTAFTVIITDNISTRLDLGQFEMLAASHNYKLRLNDNNQFEWRFENILLPDSGRNELASHGFVRFRIKSKTGLVLGDSIANQAAIYFDYNAPVITNFAVTKVAYPTGIRNQNGDLQLFKLYPNPANNYVIVAAEFKKNVAAKVTLVNMLGQVISEVTLPANNQIHFQMPLNNLPKGVYVVQLETEAGRQTQRLVIQ